jgi:hypothetical protein
MNIEAYRAILRRLGVESASEPSWLGVPAAGADSAWSVPEPCQNVPPTAPPADDVAVSLRAFEPEAAREAPATTRTGGYAYPWPDGLQGLGPRLMGPFDRCADCGSGSWARYGAIVLCLRCALQRERT